MYVQPTLTVVRHTLETPLAPHSCLCPSGCGSKTRFQGDLNLAGGLSGWSGALHGRELAQGFELGLRRAARRAAGALARRAQPARTDLAGRWARAGGAWGSSGAPATVELWPGQLALAAGRTVGTPRTLGQLAALARPSRWRALRLRAGLSVAGGWHSWAALAPDSGSPGAQRGAALVRLGPDGTACVPAVRSGR